MKMEDFNYTSYRRNEKVEIEAMHHLSFPNVFSKSFFAYIFAGKIRFNFISR